MSDWNDWRAIPKYAIDTQEKFGTTELDATFTPVSIEFYDAIDDDTNNGYRYEEDLVAAIVASSATTDIEITLSPTDAVPGSKIEAMYVSNNSKMKPDVYDASSMIFTEENPIFYTKNEIKKNNLLLFATVNQTIYEDDSSIDGLISQDTQVFYVKYYDPKYDINGNFLWAKITLEKSQKFKAKKGTITVSDGTVQTSTDDYVRINFYKKVIQPKFWKRTRIEFEDKPIFYELTLFDGNGQKIDWEFSDRDKIKEEIFYQPFIPLLSNNELQFIAVWSNEAAWWNANRSKFSISTNNLISGTYGIDVVGKDNEPNFIIAGTIITSLDGTTDEYLIKNGEYKGGYFETSRISGPADSKRDELIEFMSDILSSDNSLASTFNTMNYVVAIDSTSETSPLALGRKESQDTAPWIERKYESIFSYDIASNLTNDVALHRSYLDISSVVKTANLESNDDNDDLSFNKEEYIDSRVDFIRDMLQKKATLMGVNLSSLEVPTNVNESFDTSGKPQDWDQQELARYIGWLPVKDNEWDVDGRINNYQNAIDVNSLSSSNTRQITYGFGNAGYKYASGITLKAKTLIKNFYSKTEDNKYILEIETSDKDINFNLGRIRIGYAGGYEYTMFHYRNTRQEAIDKSGIPDEILNSGNEDLINEYLDENGNEFCVDDYGNDLILSYSAENRRGTPRALITEKIYGSTSDAQRQLQKRNKKLILENSKYIYDTQTGKKIKNKRYNKKERSI